MFGISSAHSTQLRFIFDLLKLWIQRESVQSRYVLFSDNNSSEMTDDTKHATRAVLIENLLLVQRNRNRKIYRINMHSNRSGTESEKDGDAIG